MTADTPAEMPGYLLPSEFHNLVLSMYPAVSSCGYEVCKAGGANHTAVIPLEIPADTSSSSSGTSPYWCPDRLKSVIKRRAKIIIRPLATLNLNEMVERPVSFMRELLAHNICPLCHMTCSVNNCNVLHTQMNPHHVTCYRCNKTVAITLWDLHTCSLPQLVSIFCFTMFLCVVYSMVMVYG